MALQLLLGTLDLTQYLDPQPGNGMDPANPEFSERVFSHSLLKEGGTLALTNLKVKELVFPLYLKAVSKAALHKLVQQINSALELPGQTASFQDDGATIATVFDLVSGQLDLEYDYRRAQQNYLHAKLRLFAQPLGLANAPRVLATIAGTAPVMIMNVPTMPLGDQDALLRVSAMATTKGARYFGMAVLPNASYPCLYTAPSGLIGGTNFATKVGGSGAAASQFFRIGSNPGGVFTGFLLAGLRAADGPHRLFGIVRNWAASGTTLQYMYTGSQQSFFGPTAVMPHTASGAWTTIDLGTLRLPPPYASTVHTPTTVDLAINVNIASNVDLCAVVSVPDNAAVFIDSHTEEIGSSRNVLFDGINNACFAYSETYPSDGTFDVNVNTLSRGAIPRLPQAPFLRAPSAARIAILLLPGMGIFGEAQVEVPNEMGAATVEILERTRYLF